MESRGNLDYQAGGCDSFSSTLHWGPFWPEDPYQLTHKDYQLPKGQTFNDEFHIFGLKWSANAISTYLDNETNVILNVTIDQSFWNRGGWNSSGLDNPWRDGGLNAPFDQEFYLIFNLAVGGTGGYFPDGMGEKKKIDFKYQTFSEPQKLSQAK